ncbi:MAG: PorV/PorQ family protein [bacterium]|nr:PorV/PorQ family protein [bacterium]
MKKAFLIGIIFTFYCLLPTIYSFAKGEGGDALAFLKIGVGARPLALGKAFVAVADSANACYWNPAGLTQVEKPELTFMYSQPYLVELSDVNVSGISYHTISAALPFGANVIGTNIIYLGITDIPEYDVDIKGDPVDKHNTFGDTEMAVLASYARKINNLISLGCNIKGVYQQIYSSSYKDTGFGLDIGALLKPIVNLKIGIALHDLVAPTVKLDNEEDKPPLRFQLGVAYLPTHDLLIAISTRSISDRSLNAYLGLEYQLISNIAVRGGYSTDNEEISGGIGFRHKNLQVDLGLSSHALGGTPRASLTLRF